jgi:hypothetical protein
MPGARYRVISIEAQSIVEKAAAEQVAIIAAPKSIPVCDIIAGLTKLNIGHRHECSHPAMASAL